MRKAKQGDFYFDNINGYIIECVRGHPLFPGKVWVGQHRRVMAEKLKRSLQSNEIVHHKDDNKTNNSIKNLILTTRINHPKLHTGHKRSEETKTNMKKSAVARCTKEWRAAVSKRVKEQHKAGKFGSNTWRSK